MENYYLKSALAFSQHDFAIIDRAKLSAINTSWPVQELVSPMLQPQAYLYPLCLSLKEMNPSDWHCLIGQQQTEAPGKPPLCRLLLKSDWPEHEVYRQLIDALHYTDEKKQKHIFRYYDPQVLFHLSWMFSLGKLTELIPVRQFSHWTFWLEGQWHTLEFLPASSMSFPFEHAKDDTLTRLRNIGIINGLLMRMPPISDITERLNKSRHIEMLLSKAQEMGLSHREDLHIFAESGLSRSPDFWKSPAIQAVVKQSKGFPQFFNRKIRYLSESDWQAVLAQVK
ncbi:MULTISPECIES: DUF4123 domain-containing protein [Yersiniaceae]|uniref:DUF4123 domain-containing protein n=1 Tax=Yersiniaceae TaxID=1903411 RepID=UPI0009337DAD|nr:MULTISPECIES: DUF4123 domain-containing protein [Yersiniaceae]MDV5140547.1 DUF4123 domain-containing protein [Chimaeribacter arupi]